MVRVIYALVALAGLMAAAAGTAVVLAIRAGGLRGELAEMKAVSQDNFDAAAGWRKVAGERRAEVARWKQYADHLEKEIEDAEKLCSAGGDPGDARDALLRLLSQRNRRPGAGPGGVDPTPLPGPGEPAADGAERRGPHPMPD
jgi:hypothetical protein